MVYIIYEISNITTRYSLSIIMKASASSSRARPQFKVRDMLKCEDIPVVIHEELAIENDSSNAPCMGELVQDSDKEQNCDDVQQQLCSIKWTQEKNQWNGLAISSSIPCSILYHQWVFFTILNWLAKK